MKKDISKLPKWAQNMLSSRDSQITRLDKQLKDTQKNRDEWQQYANRNLPGPPIAGMYKGNGFVLDLDGVIEMSYSENEQGKIETIVHTVGGQQLSYTGTDTNMVESWLSYKQWKLSTGANR
jgi:hypothetical protein